MRFDTINLSTAERKGYNFLLLVRVSVIIFYCEKEIREHVEKMVSEMYITGSLDYSSTLESN